MWIFISHWLILATLVRTASSSVTVTCTSCPDPNKIQGIVGEDLVLQYVISDKVFHMLTIQFNGELNHMEISSTTVNTNGVKDKRLKSKMRKKSDSFEITVTLEDLTLQDDNVKFNYVYMDYNLDVQPKVEQTLRVWSPPRFCTPPRETYTTWESRNKNRNNNQITFSVCGNPKPNVTARLGPIGAKGDARDVGVIEGPEKKAYQRDYTLAPFTMNREQCVGKIVITAKSYSTITTSTVVRLRFTPAVVTGVTAQRDFQNRLNVAWDAVTYGDCRVRYHVRRTTNVTTVEFQTTATSYRFLNAVGNNTISVNAEVNDVQGPYSASIFIPELLPLATPDPSASQSDDGLDVGTIVGIVAGIVIVGILLGVLLIVSRKRIDLSDYFKTGMKDDDDDEQPFSFHAPVHSNGTDGDKAEYNRDKNKYNGDYVDVNNIMNKLHDEEQQKRQQQEQQHPQQQQQPQNAIYANMGPGVVPNHAPPPYQAQLSSDDSDSMRKSRDSETDSYDGSYDYADSVIV